jgi:hypothetical protein
MGSETWFKYFNFRFSIGSVRRDETSLWSMEVRYWNETSDTAILFWLYVLPGPIWFILYIFLYKT